MSRSRSETEDRRRTSPATRQGLLDGTKRLLAKGTTFGGLRVEDIVDEAGMSRATYYLHFSDKSELAVALTTDLVAWRDEIGAEVIADAALNREALDAMIAKIVARWVEERAVLSAIIEVAGYDPAMAAVWRAAMGDVAEKAAEQFRRRWAGRRDGPGDPDTIAEVFTWMFERSCHQILKDPSREAAVAQSISEIIWRVLEYRAA